MKATLKPNQFEVVAPLVFGKVYQAVKIARDKYLVWDRIGETKVEVYADSLDILVEGEY